MDSTSLQIVASRLEVLVVDSASLQIVAFRQEVLVLDLFHFR